jgi:hypothetical protein
VGCRQAVRTFTWSLGEQNIRTNLLALLADLATDESEWCAGPRGGVAGGARGAQLLEPHGVEWCAAGFNPPFTLPCFRTNEVMVLVQPRAAAAAAAATITSEGGDVREAGSSTTSDLAAPHCAQPPNKATL